MRSRKISEDETQMKVYAIFYSFILIIISIILLSVNVATDNKNVGIAGLLIGFFSTFLPIIPYILSGITFMIVKTNTKKKSQRSDSY